LTPDRFAASLAAPDEYLTVYVNKPTHFAASFKLEIVFTIDLIVSPEETKSSIMIYVLLR
jgi:hypothetical protein